MNIGKAIRLCRIQKDMLQSELAERAGISVSYVCLVEKGKRDPNFSTVKSIAAALSIPVTILTFLAVTPDELNNISPELAEKFSYISLALLKEPTNEN